MAFVSDLWDPTDGCPGKSRASGRMGTVSPDHFYLNAREPTSAAPTLSFCYGTTLNDAGGITIPGDGQRRRLASIKKSNR